MEKLTTLGRQPPSPLIRGESEEHRSGLMCFNNSGLYYNNY